VIGDLYRGSLNLDDEVAVSRHIGIVGYQSQRHRQSLGRQNSVERITVQGWLSFDASHMRGGSIQQLEAGFMKVANR
jgi:hypothetical protein